MRLKNANFWIRDPMNTFGLGRTIFSKAPTAGALSNKLGIFQARRKDIQACCFLEDCKKHWSYKKKVLPAIFLSYAKPSSHQKWWKTVSAENIEMIQKISMLILILRIGVKWINCSYSICHKWSFIHIWFWWYLEELLHVA